MVFVQPADSPPPLSLVAALTISPANPVVGQPVTASYLVKNTGGEPLTVPLLFVGARDPNGANVDFGYVPDVLLQPGQQYAFQQSHTFATVGTYTVWPAAYLNGVYQAIDPTSPPVQFSLQQSKAPQVVVVGPLVAVRPLDSPVGAAQAELLAARNEFESFQIVVRADTTDLTNVSISLTATLTGAGTIPANNVTIYREDYYEVDLPSDSEGAIGQWPDALIPTVDPWLKQERPKAFPIDIPAGQNRVAWVDVLVPQDAEVGQYSGSLMVTSTSFAVTVPIQLTVFNATLPSTSSLASAFGMGWNDVCQARYGNDCFSAATEAEGWRLNSLLARIALENRVTICSAQYQPLNPGNLSIFRQYLLPFLNGTGQTRLPGARLTSFQVDTDAIAAWKEEAQNQGFADLAFIYACDEPGNDQTKWGKCQQQAESARAVWQDIPILVTATIQNAEQANATGYVNWLVCIVNFMDDKPGNSSYAGPQRGYYDSFLALNPVNRVWLYTSCMSHGCDPDGSRATICQGSNPSGPATTDPYFNSWPGYVIDEPPSEARAMGWMSFLYETSGELYFDVSHCLSSAWTKQYAYGGNGDGTIFYPGDPQRIGGSDWIPLESLRLKRIRDGYEDYEYLKILADRGLSAEAQAIVKDLFTNMYSSNQSDDALRLARRKLANLIDPTVAVDI